MAYNVTRQYRPISTEETDTDDALSVRFARDMADNLNNYALYVGNHKLLGYICVPEWQSHSSTTDERVVWSSAGRRIPDGYTHLRWILKHYRFAGSANTTWTLYCSGWHYEGPHVLDTNYLTSDYSSATITTSSAVHMRDTDDSLSVVRGMDDMSFFVLTAENADSSSRAAITSLDLWPAVGVTEMVWAI